MDSVNFFLINIGNFVRNIEITEFSGVFCIQLIVRDIWPKLCCAKNVIALPGPNYTANYSTANNLIARMEMTFIIVRHDVRNNIGKVSRFW